MKKRWGWSRREVDFNVFEVGSQFFTNGTKYDPKSIMHYSIDAWQTMNGYSLKDNYELSWETKPLSQHYTRGVTPP